MNKGLINLDDLLAAERNAVPEPSTRLMENILADAGAVATARTPAPHSTRPNLLRRLLEPVGGYPAMAGAMAAVVFGVYVGYSGTKNLESLPMMGDYIANLSSDPFDDLGLGDFGNFDALTEG